MEKRTREGSGPAGRRGQRARAATFIAVGALVLGAGSYPAAEAFSASDRPPVIDIKADMGGFSPREVRVKAGRPVTVRLTSLDNSHHVDGGGKHQWAVDELGVNIVAPPEGSSSQTFTPAKPGTYTFYCDICCGGRANPTMRGRLVVEA